MAELNIKINGETANLDASLKQVNSLLSNTKREITSLNKELKFDSSSVDTLTRKQEALQNALTLSRARASELRSQLAAKDINSDPLGFRKISTQLTTARNEMRSFERELSSVNTQLSGVSNHASKIKLNTDSSVTFKHSIEGANAALARLGGVTKLISFDAAKASAQDVEHTSHKISDAINVLGQKSDILQRRLSSINPEVNPTGFLSLQSEINKTQSEIEALNNKKLSIDIGVNGQSLKSGSASNILNVGKSALSGIVNRFGSVVSAVNSKLMGIGAVPGVASAIMRNVANIPSLIINLFKAIPYRLAWLGAQSAIKFSSALLNSVVSASKNIGGVIAKIYSTISSTAISGLRQASSAIAQSVGSIFEPVQRGIGAALKAPFKAITGIANQVTIGALRQVGSNITMALTSTLRGVVGAQQEAMKSTISLTNVLNFVDVDPSKIKSIVSDIQAYARTTTYMSGSLNKVVASLSAVGVESDRLVGLTTNIANAYKLLGDGSVDVSNIGVIFSQIHSAGKLMAQDFNQLRNAGLGGAIAKDITENMPQVVAKFGTFQKAMAKGAISAKMVEDSITRIGSSDSAIKAATVPRTIGEALQKMRITIGQAFYNTFVKVNDRIIDIIQNITKAIGAFDFSNADSAISRVLEKMITLAFTLYNIISKLNFSAFEKSAASAISSITGYFKSLFQTSGFATFLAYTRLLMANISAILRDIGANITTVFNVSVASSALQVLAATIYQVSQAVRALVRSTQFSAVLSGVLSGILAVYNTTLSVISQVSKSVIASIQNINVAPMVNTIKSLFNTIGTIITSIITIVARVGSSIITAFSGSAVTSSVTSLLSSIEALTQSLVQFITTLISMNAVTVILSGLASIFNSVLNVINAIVVSVTNLMGLSGLSIVSSAISYINTGLLAIANVISSITNSIRSTDLSPLMSIFSQLASTIMGTMQTAISVIASVGRTLFAVFNSADVAASITALLQLVTSTITAIGSAINNIVNIQSATAVINIVISLFNTLLSVINIIVDALNRLSSIPVFTSLTQLLSGVLELIVSIATLIASVVVDTASNVNASTIDSITEKIHQLSESILNISNNVSQYLQPLRNTVSDLSNYFGQLFAQMKSTVDTSTFDILQNIMSNLYKAIKATGDVLLDVFGSPRVTNTINTVGNAINNLISAFSKLMEYNRTSVFLQQTIKVFGQFVAVVLNVANSIVDAVKSIIDNIDISDTAETLMEYINTVGSWITTAINGIGSVISYSFSDKDFLDNTQELFKSLTDSLSSLQSSDVWTGITSVLGSILELVFSINLAFSNLIVGTLQSMDTSTLDNLSKQLHDIGDTITQISNSNGLQQLLASILEIASEIIVFVIGAIASIAQVITQVLDQLAPGIKSVTDIIKTVIGYLQTFIDGLVGGFKWVMDGLKKTGIMDFVNDAFSDLSKSLKKASSWLNPLMDALGNFIGFIAGTLFGKSLFILGGLAKALSTIVDAITDLINIIKKAGETVISNILKLFGADDSSSDYSQSYNYSSLTEYAASAYSSSVSSTSVANTVSINVTASPNMDTVTLARDIKRQFELGLA